MSLSTLNQHTLIGHLGVDPTAKKLEKGWVANFTVATNESWTDKASGEVREHTEWHYVVLYNKLAEVARDYLKKGSRVYLSGPVKTRQWNDDQDQTHYKKEIIGNKLMMLDKNKKAEEAIVIDN